MTFCRFPMGWNFSTNVFEKHKTFAYHKTVFEAYNPAYCDCAVITSIYYSKSFNDANNLSQGLIVLFVKSKYCKDSNLG